MRILCHFSIPIPDSPLYTVMDAISTTFVWWGEAQLRPKRPQTETTNPPAPTIPSTSASSSSMSGVAIEAVMAQLQHMNGHLDTLTTKLYQVNTHVDCIAWWQARFGGFVASPSPSLEVSEDEDVADGNIDDVDEDASSSSDDETTSQWLTHCHSWQKGRVVLGWWE